MKEHVLILLVRLEANMSIGISSMMQSGFKSGDFNEGRKDLAVVLTSYGKSMVFYLVSSNW